MFFNLVKNKQKYTAKIKENHVTQSTWGVDTIDLS